MNWLVTINQVTTLALAMLIGWAARKKNLLTPEIRKGLSALLVNVSLPVQIIASFTTPYSSKVLINGLTIFLGALAIQIFSLLIGNLLFGRYEHSQRAVLRFITVFSNNAFMGFAILAPLFGSQGVFYASFYVMAFNILAWTMGISFFTGKKSEAKISQLIKNPGIAAVLLGLVIFILPLGLPTPLLDAFKLIGSINAPLSMLLVGAVLAETDLRTIFKGQSSYAISLVRLLVIPLGTLLVLFLVRIPKNLASILVILAAMPAPTMTSIFAELYNGHTLLASKYVFLTTLLSILTIPFIVYLLQVFGFM